MRGSAIARGRVETGVNALAGRDGAGTTAGPGAVAGAGRGTGWVPVHAVKTRNTAKNAKRRMRPLVSKIGASDRLAVGGWRLSALICMDRSLTQDKGDDERSTWSGGFSLRALAMLIASAAAALGTNLASARWAQAHRSTTTQHPANIRINTPVAQANHRRQPTPTTKKKAPAKNCGGLYKQRAMERYGRIRRMTTRRLRRRPSAVVLSPIESAVPRPSTVMRAGSIPWRVTR